MMFAPLLAVALILLICLAGGSFTGPWWCWPVLVLVVLTTVRRLA